MQIPDFETEDFWISAAYDQPVDQSVHRKIEDILSFRDKKSAALEVLYKNAMCFMDHESDKPPVEVVKTNKQIQARNAGSCW